MPPYIRRSLIALSIDDPKLADKAFDSWADAIVLDIVKDSGQDWQQTLKGQMPAAIKAASRGGAEVFVRLSAQTAYAELEATVFVGLTGVVFVGVAEASELSLACAKIDALELERGIPQGSLEVDLEITTAQGVWNSLEIARVSSRLGTMAINEQALYQNLDIPFEDTLEVEPIEFIKGQIITVATSVNGQAQGMSYPLCITQKVADEVTLKKAILRARDTGFKGALCAHPSWVKHCNEGFRPSADEVEYYKEVRKVFAEGLKRGLASVPLNGKMIDVPVDLRAEVYLEWADRVALRDQQKIQAHQQAQAVA
jgi:citrate lyase subunit beta/citryl-CoA lyase